MYNNQDRKITLDAFNGSVKPEAPDSGLGDGGKIEGGGNGDSQSPAKLHSTNVWEAWEEY